MTTSTPHLTAAATEHGLDSAWWALRLGIGVTAFAAGLDKFFNLLTDWNMYVAPWVERLTPIAPSATLRIFGVVEMAAAVLILSRWTRLGGYVVAAWLGLVAVQLLTTGMFFDLAARDVVMAIAAFALAKLTEWRQPATRKETR
jgi:hypothetical protein